MFGHEFPGIELLARPASPAVGFLAANPLPGIEARVEVHARLEVVIRVGDEAGRKAVLAEHLGKRGAAFLQGNPAAMRSHRDDALAGVIDAAAGNRRQTVGVSVRERHALGGQAVERRCLDPRAAERISHNEDEVPGRLSRPCLGGGRPGRGRGPRTGAAGQPQCRCGHPDAARLQKRPASRRLHGMAPTSRVPWQTIRARRREIKRNSAVRAAGRSA